jgi:fructose-bisphosphate aldolase class II
VVKLAHACGVSVEAEIGSVGYTDAKMRAKAIYTDPSEAKIFAEQTGVDALAVAVGTLHRMQSQGANIQFDRLAAIREVVAVPLVIHGSTGVTDDDLARLAGYGVGKVNIGTALRMTFGRTIRQVMSDNPQEFDRIKMFKKPMQAVEAQAKNKFRILGFSGNA